MQGGINYSPGCALCFPALANISITPPQHTAKDFMTSKTWSLTALFQQGFVQHSTAKKKSRRAVLDSFFFSFFHLQTKVLTALFTCSLPWRWKAAGVGLFGCPPCPRRILCSAQFLQRQKVCGWQSEAGRRRGGCNEGKNKTTHTQKKKPLSNSELLSDKLHSSLTAGS